MDVYKIYTDYKDFVVQAEDISTALNIGVNLVQNYIDEDAAESLKIDTKTYNELVEAGKEIPEWLVDIMVKGQDKIEDCNIYKIKRIGELSNLAPKDANPVSADMIKNG